MLTLVVIGVSISLLVVFVLVLLSVLEVVFAGPQPARTSLDALRQWQPPLAGGDQLLAWASDMAESVTTNRLARMHGADTAKHLAKEIYDGSTFAIAQSRSAVGQSEPNCPSCRHRMIGVTPPEALAIADELRGTKPKREVKRIHDRARNNVEMIVDIGHEQYEKAMIVCPLLAANDSCNVFDARPIQCRGWCLFSGEDGDRCLLAESESGPLDAHAYTVGRGAEDGLSRGLEAAGLDGNVYELNSALVAALGTPSAAERWADGEPVFRECKLCD